jgi:hypothetical protein
VLQWIVTRLRALESDDLVAAVFLRLLGIVYIVSFASFLSQIVALVGSHGIAPAAEWMVPVRARGIAGFVSFPTLFWFGINDGLLKAACVMGCVAGLVLVSGWFSRVAAGVCWLLYLSIVTVGQPFSNFQWDALLLEAGFLALFLGVPLTTYAYRFLLFRLMFESGAVKLLSRDENWRNLHALRFHFLTQPLPNPLAYYAHRLPARMLDGMTATTLLLELLTPFLLFAPRRLRFIAGVCFMLLQILILLTGNYAFFNLLTLALCFWAFDNRMFEPLKGFLRPRAVSIQCRFVHRVAEVCVGVVIVIALVDTIGLLLPAVPAPVEPIVRLASSFGIVNRYGLFAVMTTTRTELVIEGSEDGVNWRAYEFRYKPGELHRALPVVAPYQPRLDWQMWFAALGSYNDNLWVGGLLRGLLLGDSAIEALLLPSPFQKPPTMIRVLAYDYQFTTPAERSRTGAVWERRLLGTWFGPASLKH